MSARIPVRRLGQAPLAFRPRSTQWATLSSSRSISLFSSKNSKSATSIRNAPNVDPNNPLSNPMMDRWLQKHGSKKPRKQAGPQHGTLSNNPLVTLEQGVSVDGDSQDPEEAARKKLKAKKRTEYDLHAARLDPAPHARRRFERKMVIRDLSRHRRVTKAIKLARTERQLLFRSQDIPTSTKKLTRIMHLITGRTIEEALVQLRFSNKRIARDVFKGLQIARDEAITKRGMGLGPSSAPLASKSRNEQYIQDVTKAAGETAKAEAEAAGLENAAVEKAVEAAIRATIAQVRKQLPQKAYLADGTNIREHPVKGPLIELKDGSKKRVYDPTEIYIDQAWVGKGSHSNSYDHRARGRVNKLTHRTASFSLLLKEEKTRMRVSEEIKKKRANRPLWLPLPDRPVTSQRQYCLW